MTQKERDLVMKDLCGRIPYECIVNIADYGDFKFTSINWWEEVGVDDGMIQTYDIQDVRPYLRPMSSMTEEEQRFISEKFNADKWGSIETYSSSEDGIAEVFIEDIHGLIDWLDKKMFDYRYLIPKGLALDATEGMYNN